ncbi:nicotinate-nucleotide adenylyltransferase [Stenotrophomonas sp. HITSZ_GD]|uniref:nicotinate-nucleotide adenylyltransferase n=1 Tax=Stenotrophomonas sp. HITSZ_GD TaxID=3037248 RepID=UPI00240E5BB1|nr:nicotinate-nucleotide adenylyltransferase [Stenotrophomonas sp. HITSZ_GD]MDG2524453.1 nicotinate-nucleotide adenylyltransferase [Stenotrophomonas sp. HITSZ_GD]
MHAPDAEDALRLCYGGTFDPIHSGHLAIACAARDALHVPVWLIPAADPPHRAAPGAAAAQRAAMIALAIEGLPGLRLDLREIERARTRDRPSYTYDTLRELRHAFGPTRPLAWLMGADSFVGLAGWHRWRELGELAHLVIAERPGSGLDAALPAELAAWAQPRWTGDAAQLRQRPGGLLWRLHQPLRSESASQVRGEIAEGGPWRALVPAAVARYIEGHGLYAARPA